MPRDNTPEDSVRRFGEYTENTMTSSLATSLAQVFLMLRDRYFCSEPYCTSISVACLFKFPEVEFLGRNADALAELEREKERLIQQQQELKVLIAANDPSIARFSDYVLKRELADEGKFKSALARVRKTLQEPYNQFDLATVNGEKMVLPLVVVFPVVCAAIMDVAAYPVPEGSTANKELEARSLTLANCLIALADREHEACHAGVCHDLLMTLNLVYPGVHVIEDLRAFLSESAINYLAQKLSIIRIANLELYYQILIQWSNPSPTAERTAVRTFVDAHADRLRECLVAECLGQGLVELAVEPGTVKLVPHVQAEVDATVAYRGDLNPPFGKDLLLLRMHEVLTLHPVPCNPADELAALRNASVSAVQASFMGANVPRELACNRALREKLRRNLAFLLDVDKAYHELREFGPELVQLVSESEDRGSTSVSLLAAVPAELTRCYQFFRGCNSMQSHLRIEILCDSATPQEHQRAFRELLQTARRSSSTIFFIANFFARWFSDGIDEHRALYNGLITPDMQSRLVLTDERLGTMFPEGGEVDITPYRINLVLLYAMMNHPQRWSAEFYRCLSLTMDFIRADFNHAATVSATSLRTSYPPELLNQFDCLRNRYLDNESSPLVPSVGFSYAMPMVLRQNVEESLPDYDSIGFKYFIRMLVADATSSYLRSIIQNAEQFVAVLGRAISSSFKQDLVRRLVAGAVSSYLRGIIERDVWRLDKILQALLPENRLLFIRTLVGDDKSYLQTVITGGCTIVLTAILREFATEQQIEFVNLLFGVVDVTQCLLDISDSPVIGMFLGEASERSCVSALAASDSFANPEYLRIMSYLRRVINSGGVLGYLLGALEENRETAYLILRLLLNGPHAAEYLRNIIGGYEQCGCSGLRRLLEIIPQNRRMNFVYFLITTDDGIYHSHHLRTIIKYEGQLRDILEVISDAEKADFINLLIYEASSDYLQGLIRDVIQLMRIIAFIPQMERIGFMRLLTPRYLQECIVQRNSANLIKILEILPDDRTRLNFVTEQLAANPQYLRDTVEGNHAMSVDMITGILLDGHLTGPRSLQSSYNRLIEILMAFSSEVRMHFLVDLLQADQKYMQQLMQYDYDRLIGVLMLFPEGTRMHFVTNVLQSSALYLSEVIGKDQDKLDRILTWFDSSEQQEFLRLLGSTHTSSLCLFGEVSGSRFFSEALRSRRDSTAIDESADNPRCRSLLI